MSARTDDDIFPKTIADMPAYILRNIDPDLWKRVKERAAAEGRSLRGLILWLLQRYADGKVK